MSQEGTNIEADWVRVNSLNAVETLPDQNPIGLYKGNIHIKCGWISKRPVR
jgi:hypothetical protein